MPDLPHRDKAERTLAMILLPEFERQTDVLLRGGLKPLPESQWLAMRSGLATAMEPQLRRTYRLAALLMLTDLSVPLDADDLFSGWESDLANRSRHYARWRAARVGEWMQGSIRRRYEALAAKAEANALAAEEVANEIKKILDEARAERVAANETTASVTAGETGMADVARQYGGPVIAARWNTERDERTCHICWPLHRQSLTEVPLELQAGPPAHDLCRCWLTWELKDAEVGAAVMESVFLENCGSGDEGNPGFQVGNTCAKGDGGGGKAAKNDRDAAAEKRVEEVRKQAKEIPLTNDLIRSGGNESDDDEIEAAMTDEERREMNRYLDELAEDAADEAVENYDPEIDREEVARDNGYSQSGINTDMELLIRRYGGDKEGELSGVLDEWYNGENEHGEEAIENIRSQLVDAGAPPELVAAMDKYRDKASEAIEAEYQRAYDDTVDEVRGIALYNVDIDTHRRAYLQDWRDNNNDRVTAAKVYNVWGKDANGDRAFAFKTSAGDEYSINTFVVEEIQSALPGVDIRTVAFSDSGGSFKITGRGNAHEVFSHVSAAVTSLAEKEKLAGLMFTAAEPSRQRLYDRLARSAAAVMPDYVALAYSHGNDPKTYLVARRDAVEKIKQAPVFEDMAAGMQVLAESQNEPDKTDGWEELPAEIDPAWWTPEGWEDDA